MNIAESLQSLSIPIGSVILDPANARVGHDIESIKNSLLAYGQRTPIVVNKRTGIVLKGNGTLTAAREIGSETIAAVFVDDDPMTATSYAIADNRIGDKSHFDDAALKRLLDSVESPLDIPGIDAEFLAALDSVVQGLGDDGGKEQTDTEPQTDIADELKDKWGVEPGQLWQLGNHRILCGDSTKKEDVELVLGGIIPLLMVTDPPYGVKYDPTRNSDNKAKAGVVFNDDRADWTEAWQLFPGDIAYVWHASMFTNVVLESLENCGFKHRAMIIWAKDRFTLGWGDYQWKHEPCWYCVKDKANHMWIGGRDKTTVWELPAREDSGHGHGTQKPLECMARAIRNHDSEYVYEPFSGSGTTIIACENLGRKCLAIEISPGYVAVALERWSKHTGKIPELLEHG